MKVRMIDGKIFEGRDEAEVVAKMRKDSWTPENSLEAYMRETSKRAMIQTGLPVDWDNPVDFIRDLENAGLVEIRKED